MKTHKTGTDRRWNEPHPTPSRCDEPHDGNLCPEHSAMLDRLTADIPAMLAELNTAETRQARLAPGTDRHSSGERQPLPWNERAANIARQLRQLDRAELDPFQRRAQLSDLATLAHKTIDRPIAPAYTQCPQCQADVADYGHDAITCTECGYAAPRLDWHQANLERLQNRLLTMSQLLEILRLAGKPLTRAQILRLSASHGLPREIIHAPTWQAADGQILPHFRATYAYRARDVLALAWQLESYNPSP